MGRRAPVDVFAFRDHREFLRAFYERKAGQQAGFTYAAFSERVGVRTPNYLRLVIDGQRNLSDELTQRFGQACELTGDALAYFCALVAYGQAKTATERSERYAAMQGFDRFRATHRLDAAQSAYHAEWYIPVVYELCARPDFRADPTWIGAALLPAISAKQAAKALSVLRKLGLLEERGGRLVQRQDVVETPEGPLGHQVAAFHRSMMARAGESIDVVPRDDREIAALTLCVSDSQMRELKAELEAFRKQLLERYLSDPAPERVVQVNFQMFPLSRACEGAVGATDKEPS